MAASHVLALNDIIYFAVGQKIYACLTCLGGGLRKRWLDNIREDMKEYNMTEEMA